MLHDLRGALLRLGILSADTPPNDALPALPAVARLIWLAEHVPRVLAELEAYPVHCRAGPLSADDLRRALDLAGLSQTGGAKLVGVSARAMRRWCSAPADRCAPETVGRLLWVLARVKGAQKALEKYGHIVEPD